MTPIPSADGDAADGPPIILHVLDHAVPELTGYSIRCHNVLRTLRSQGVPVVAMAPADAAGSEADHVDGVPYLYLPRRGSRSGSLRAMLELGRHLHRVLRARHVALVHAHTPARSGCPAWWAARRAGVPVVYEWHGVWEESGIARGRMTRRSVRYHVGRRLETWLVRRVDAVAVISQGLMDEARRRGVATQRIAHVPNGVDTRHFCPRPADPELAAHHGLQGKFVVGFIGFFFAYEGIDILLHAFARLHAQRPDARLLLVGDGDTQDALRAEVRRLHLEAQVVMTGPVPHADVPRYYALCDVLVYPRRRGPATELVTPLRPLEAMAMGRTVVASDLGGLREIVRDGDTGVLVDADDAVRLAGALAALAAEPSARNRLGARARRFAAEERDWDRLAAIYSALYARLLAPVRVGWTVADDRRLAL